MHRLHTCFIWKIILTQFQKKNWFFWSLFPQEPSDTHDLFLLLNSLLPYFWNILNLSANSISAEMKFPSVAVIFPYHPSTYLLWTLDCVCNSLTDFLDSSPFSHITWTLLLGTKDFLSFHLFFFFCPGVWFSIHFSWFCLLLYPIARYMKSLNSWHNQSKQWKINLVSVCFNFTHWAIFCPGLNSTYCLSHLSFNPLCFSCVCLQNHNSSVEGHNFSGHTQCLHTSHNGFHLKAH